MDEISEDEVVEDDGEDVEGTHVPGGGSKGDIFGGRGADGAKIDGPVHLPGGGSGRGFGNLP